MTDGACVSISMVQHTGVPQAAADDHVSMSPGDITSRWTDAEQQQILHVEAVPVSAPSGASKSSWDGYTLATCSAAVVDANIAVAPPPNVVQDHAVDEIGNGGLQPPATLFHSVGRGRGRGHAREARPHGPDPRRGPAPVGID